MDEGINELFTYCAKEKGRSKNIVAKIKSREIEKWNDGYKDCFSESYFSSTGQKSNVRLMYTDPDTTYKTGFNHHFFEQLVVFLTKQECRLKEKLEGKYQYTFEEGKGIKVEDDSNTSFYLRSDQLGFSAPTNERVYPYDLYLMKSKGTNTELEQVANWIITSRTIGGSFLWPEEFYKIYNLSRGGKISSKNRFYIQDRVDLTLWEIHYWYNENEKLTIMTRVKDEQAKEDLQKWLSHFKTFETYIEFFCFQDFVNDKSSPINILEEGAQEPSWDNNIRDRKPEITEQLTIETIYNMLDRVNTMILKRSKRIEEIIKQRI